MKVLLCPQCGQLVLFSSKRGRYFCAECEAAFDAAPEATSENSPRANRRVFLSYGHDEASCELVRRINDDLQQAGWDPWIDEKRIQFGDDWRREITEGIRTSSHVLAFLSRHSTRKPGVCRQEIAIALGHLKGHVYTVLVEPLAEVTPPLLISHLQWLDMNDWRQLKAKDPDEFEAMYRKGLEEILRVLETNQPFAGEIEELHHWLQPLDCTSDMIAAEEGFTGRQWLLGGIEASGPAEEDDPNGQAVPGEIERWRTSGSAERVYWLSAGPGWGKSAVAARLAHAGRARVMAVHFCRQDQPVRCDAHQVVRSLAYQMATQLPDYRGHLVGLARQGTTLEDKNASELFQELLANPLAPAIGGGRGPQDRHLIVLDALDETIDARGRSELLSLLAGEISKLPAWIGFVVTSRPEAPVMRQLGAFGVHHQSVDDPRNLQDVRAYVENWLERLQLDSLRQDKARDGIMAASAGNFLYVRKLQQAVLDGIVRREELFQPMSLPQGLASLYERWFQRRFLDPKEFDRVQRPLLELMAAAREPLPLDLARGLLQWGPYGKAKALESLGTLCTTNDGSLTFFHKSLRDWLADPNASGRDFHASEDAGHARMAEGLWRAYLAWRQAGACLEGDHGLDALGEAGARYAMRHLAEHLRLAGRGEDQRQALLDFALAIRRCAQGFVDALLRDYRAELGAPTSDPLAAWADCLCTQAHLLRRAGPQWPAHKVLLQIAVEHAGDSDITQAAEAWLHQGDCNWVWLRRLNRPSEFRPDPCLAVLEGHSVLVNGAQLLDGGRVLSWSDDGTLRIWDGASGATLAVLKGHKKSVNGAKLLADGRILSWSEDGTLRLWNRDTGERGGRYTGHLGPVCGALVMEDGRVLSWSADGTLRIWDAQSEAPLALLEEHKKAVNGAHLLKDGRVLSWSEDRTLRLWDAWSGAPLEVLEGHTSPVNGAQVLEDGRILSWSGDRTLRLWDAQTGAPLEVFDLDTGSPIAGARLHKDGRVLSWCHDSTLRLWDGKTGILLAVFLGHTKPVLGAQFLSDDRLISWSSDRTSRLWDSQSGAPLAVFEGHTGPVNGVRLLDDGRALSWSEDGTLRLWNAQTGSLLAVLFGHTDRVRGVQPVENGRVVSWSDDNTLRVWNAQGGNLLSVSDRQRSRVRGARVLGDSRVLSWSEDGTLCLRDGRTGDMLAVLKGHKKFVNGAELLPDGRVLSWSADGTLCLWDGRTGAMLAILKGHKKSVSGAQLLPDGRLLSWSDDSRLRMWDSQTGAKKPVLVGHTKRIFGAQLLRDGRILSWSADGTVRLWDGTTGAMLSVLQDDTKPVSRAQLLADGRVLSLSKDGTLRLWDCETEEMLAAFRVRQRVKGAQLLADGRVLFWSGGRTVRLLDGRSGEMLAAMQHPQPKLSGRVSGARMLDEGRVLSWSDDGTLYLWDPQGPTLLDSLSESAVESTNFSSSVERLAPFAGVCRDGPWWARALEKRISIANTNGVESAQWLCTDDLSLLGLQSETITCWSERQDLIFLQIQRGKEVWSSC